MSVGLDFTETMSGSYSLHDTPNDLLAIEFTVRARIERYRLLSSVQTATLQGSIDVEKIAKGRPARGSLLLDPIVGQRLVYDVGFSSDDGRAMRVFGQKTIEPLRLLATLTTLPAELLDGNGATIGDARLRFDARSDLARWLGSFRLVR